MDDELLRINEVAAVLRVSAFTVRRFLREGKLQGVKVGGGWRVRRSALMAFIEKGEQQT